MQNLGVVMTFIHCIFGCAGIFKANVKASIKKWMLEHRQLQCRFMDNLDTFTIYRSVDQRGPWREVVQRLFYRTDAAVVARISDNEVICLLRIPTCCSGGFGCELQSPSSQWCEKFRILVAIYKYHLWSIKCLTSLCGTFDRYSVWSHSPVTEQSFVFLTRADRHLPVLVLSKHIFKHDILTMMIIHMATPPGSLCRYRKVGPPSDTNNKATRFRYNSPKSGCAELQSREYGYPFSYAYALIRCYR